MGYQCVQFVLLNMHQRSIVRIVLFQKSASIVLLSLMLPNLASIECTDIRHCGLQWRVVPVFALKAQAT